MKYEKHGVTIHQGDVLTVLPTLAAESVHCCVTSPPYWGLRDYGVTGQLGLEAVPDCLGWATKQPCGECYVCHMVGVFREVRRVLRDDGVLWLNLGDSYATGGGAVGRCPGGGDQGERFLRMGHINTQPNRMPIAGLKPKDLCGIPWRVAFALQADGWWLRQDVIWNKPNPMPESITDRCTKAHEYVFLLSKSSRYFYDAEAVKEESTHPESLRPEGRSKRNQHAFATSDPEKGRTRIGFQKEEGKRYPTRNRRSVWTISTSPYPGGHFATFPPDLVRPCILAGTSPEGCCPQCGGPWERITEETKVMRERPNDYVKRTGEDGTGNSCANSVAGVEVKTLGWQPTCDCPSHDDTLPCTVLDPFMGAATTALVARELGCRAVGVELNPKYVRLALKRLQQPSLLV